MEIQQETINWLLDGDPAIRWQVMRDILHLEETACATERACLVESGWCADLLRRQEADGLWNRSLYNGKWISTTYTLYLLKLLGLPPLHPLALKGCDQLLSQGLHAQEEIRFSRGQKIRDMGVTALVLSICCYFGCEHEELPRIAGFLVRQQCAAGGWFPNETPFAAEYAFETTLIVLEALLQYGNLYPVDEKAVVTEAVAKGQEFLLGHSLYLEDGKPIKSQWASFSFPAYWFYDVLTALDYFRSFRMNRDVRLQPAIDLLLGRQTADGLWLLGARHSGKTYFEMEQPGKPSRWNTLRALRVLDWWCGD